jgi:hypothetical protein
LGQISEAVYITALFAFSNRVADAFGVPSQNFGALGSAPRGPRPVSSQIRFLNTIVKSLASRGKCAIFTNCKLRFRTDLASTSIDVERERLHLARGLQKFIYGFAPNPVSGLWTGCTRLKIRMLGSAIFD